MPPTITSTTIPSRSDLWLAFAVLLQGALMAVLNVTAMIPAYPQIEKMLGLVEQTSKTQGYCRQSSTTACQFIEHLIPAQLYQSVWLYALCFMLAMPCWKLLAYKLNFYRLCSTAMLMFAVASLCVALTGSQVFHLTLDTNWFLGWRLAQAISGGGLLLMTTTAIEQLRYKYSTSTLPDGLSDRQYIYMIIVVCVAVGAAIFFGVQYGNMVLAKTDDWYWLSLFNFFFGVSATALLCNLPAPDKISMRIDEIAWVVLGLALVIFALTHHLHYTEVQPILQPYQGDL